MDGARGNTVARRALWASRRPFLAPLRPGHTAANLTNSPDRPSRRYIPWTLRISSPSASSERTLGCAGQPEGNEGRTRVPPLRTCDHAQGCRTATSLRTSLQIDTGIVRYHPTPVSIAASGYWAGGGPSNS